MLPPMWGSLRGLARVLAVLVTAAVAGLLALVGVAIFVAAFLAGRPSPVPAGTGDGVPGDYEGPP